jgi:hypothetical protein
MNLLELERKLLAVARRFTPSDHVPYAFEQRVMAALRGRPAVDLCAVWAQGLWRAAAPCVGVMLLLAAWSVFAPAQSAPASNLSQELENAVLAAATPEPLADLTW